MMKLHGRFDNPCTDPFGDAAERRMRARGLFEARDFTMSSLVIGVLCLLYLNTMDQSFSRSQALAAFGGAAPQRYEWMEHYAATGLTPPDSVMDAGTAATATDAAAVTYGSVSNVAALDALRLRAMPSGVGGQESGSVGSGTGEPARAAISGGVAVAAYQVKPRSAPQLLELRPALAEPTAPVALWLCGSVQAPKNYISVPPREAAAPAALLPAVCRHPLTP